MRFIVHFFPRPRRRPYHHHELQSCRNLVDLASINWVRDRGLDHAVEKESNLKPMLNLKDLIKSEPSKSLPLSIIAQNSGSLRIPIRPIDFIRKYPSVLEEFFPGGIGIHPHVKLTTEVLDLDAEEQLIYQSDNYKQQAADRLLKLLMIARVNKIPLHIVDQLRWDLGLPQDYTQTIVPEFPDYFRVTGANDSLLELVCWSNDLAVSVLEKNAMKRKVGYEKGMPITFSLQYSRGFEIDKKFKKWVDEWQKLPYISPYENASHLPPKSDESDKWAVAILHELLHLFVPKKTERENILCLGQYLGIRSRFKRALLHHPGIFYLSSKIGTHTVVLKEAYKRDLLIEKHPLMGMRYKYIHLMNTVKEDHKPRSVQGGRTKQQKTPHDFRGEGEGENGESGEERDGKLPGTSDFEFEDDSDDCDYDDDDEEEEEEEEENEDESYIVAHKNVAANRGRTTRKTNFQEKRPMRNAPRRLAGGRPNKTNDRSPPKFSRRAEKDADRDVRGRKLERSGITRTRGRSNLDTRAST